MNGNLGDEDSFFQPVEQSLGILVFTGRKIRIKIQQMHDKKSHVEVIMFLNTPLNLRFKDRMKFFLQQIRQLQETCILRDRAPIVKVFDHFQDVGDILLINLLHVDYHQLNYKILYHTYLYFLLRLT
jgi:hypothetical protein